MRTGFSSTSPIAKSFRFVSLAIATSLILIYLPLTSSAQPQITPTANVPRWFIGDTWVIRQPYNLVTATVTEVGPDYYMVHVREDRTPIAPIQDIDVRFTKTLDADDRYVAWAHFVWPLRIGATWSRIYESPNKVQWKLAYKVSRYEKVTVPAGTFDAFRIDIQQCAVKFPSICEGLYLWYSPAVKWVVKDALDDSPHWVSYMRGKTIELISYSVTPSP
jgi:hypothetical protein